MASSRIKGITIEINGDTTGLQKALSGVDKSLQNTKTSLNDVNKLLKLDPTNVDLLQQKQGYLAKAVEDVKQKLEIEKTALEQLKGADPSDENAEKQKKLEREIFETEQTLKNYTGQWEQTEQELKDAGRVTDDTKESTKEMGDAAEEAGEATERASDGWSMGKQALVDLAEKGAELALQALKRLGEEMIQAVQDATDFADQILTLSSQTSLSTDSLQAFQYMSELIDVSLDTVTGSLTKLTNNMQSAAGGTGQAAEAFDALGISVTDQNGHLRNAEDVFYDVIDALGQMENSTERDAYSMDIFGRSAQDLNPMIEAGSDAIEGFAQEAQEMGYILDNEALSALGAADDSFERVKLQMEAVRNQIVAEMAPAIEEIATAFVEWAQTVDWEEVARGIGEIAGAVADVVMFVIEHKEVVLAAIIAITSAIVALTVAQIAMNVAMTANPIGLIIMLIGALIGVFVALEAKFHIFSEFFKEAWESIKEVVGGIVEGLKEVFLAAKDAIVHAWETVVGFFSDLWEGIKNVFATVAEFFVERFQAAVDLVRGIWEGITGFFSGLWEGIKSIFSGVADFFRGIFQGASDIVSNIIQGMISLIKMPINGVISLINVFIRGLNRIRIPSWVPGVGGRGIHISEIPLLARGGVLEKGQVGLLEGSGAEAVVPLENNSAWIKAVAQDMAKAMQGNGQTINITVNAAPGQSAEAIANVVMKKMQQAVNRKGAVYA